mgnify:CR=1 FL=1
MKKPNLRPLPTGKKSSEIVRIEGLEIHRGDKKILRGVDWTIRTGEHWVVLGPNGCGKTSLLKALTGYLTPTRGEIQLLGETFGETDWRELRKRTGLASSSIAQMISPEDSALEIVMGGAFSMIGCWGRIPPKVQASARSWLRRCEAAELAEHPWLFLSQGERQRVLIARALVARPALLLLDEPCAGLDPVARGHFLQFLSRLAAGSRTPSILLITHHVEEILPFYTHALLLSQGRVVQSGTVKTVLTSASLTAAFREPVKIQAHRGGYSLSLLDKP